MTLAEDPDAIGRQALDDVLATFSLTSGGSGVFRGLTPNHGFVRVFGGQLLAHALIAAINTVPSDKLCHSLHAYFLRPGRPSDPIDYHVESSRDGGRFAARRVVAIQDGAMIFNLAASFHVAEAGYEHQFDMPDVPSPDVLAKSGNKNFPMLRNESPIRQPFEVIDVPDHQVPKPGMQCVWFRARGQGPSTVQMKQAFLAYMSDMTLLRASMRPHPDVPPDRAKFASLDHVMWFHTPADFDDWLLYVQDSPAAMNARGLSRGTIFGRNGTIVASVAQEGLVRITDH
jgi:acyl-CoA thioesterase II